MYLLEREGMKMIKTKITKRGKFFVVQLMNDEGKYKQVAKYEDELDAKVFRKELVKEKEDTLRSVAAITVADAYKKYAEYKYDLYAKEAIGKSQLDFYNRNKKIVAADVKFQSTLLRKLSCKDLRDFFLRIYKAGQTPNAAKVICYSFKGMCEYFIREEVIEEKDYNVQFFDVNNYAELPKHKKKKTPIYNRKQFNDIYNSISNIDNTDYRECACFVVVAIIMFTGCRPAEARAIEWGNVNFETSRIKVDQQFSTDNEIIDGTKTEAGERFLLMPTKLLNILIKWKVHQTKFVAKPRYVVQHNQSINPINDTMMRAFFYQHLAKLGLAKIKHIKNDIYEIVESKFKGTPFKSLRHTVSTAILNEQTRSSALNDNVIKNQIGHADIKTTKNIYGDHNDLDISREADQEIIQGIDQALRLKYIN